MELTVVIPSRGRPECLDTTRMFHNPVLCVGEDELKAYQAVHGKRRRWLVHPPDLVGMGRKRQWVLEHVETEAVFMIDDDVTGLYCQVGERARLILDPDAIWQVLQNAARITMGIGTVCFGFSHTKDVRHFRGTHPFSFTGYVNGFAMGILGREIAFDTELDTKQDIDFSLQVLLKKRILWRDLRFAFKNSGWFKRTGGMAGIRTAETVARDIARLKSKWGDAIQVEHFVRTKKHGPHQNVHVRVLR